MKIMFPNTEAKQHPDPLPPRTEERARAPCLTVAPFYVMVDEVMEPHCPYGAAERGGAMSQAYSSPVARRGFLFRLSQAAAGLTALVAEPTRLHAAAPSASGAPDMWIDRLT